MADNVRAICLRIIHTYNHKFLMSFWMQEARDNIRNINHIHAHSSTQTMSTENGCASVSLLAIQDICLPKQPVNVSAECAECINYELLEANLFSVISKAEKNTHTSGKQTINLVVWFNCSVFFLTCNIKRTFDQVSVNEWMYAQLHTYSHCIRNVNHSTMNKSNAVIVPPQPYLKMRTAL